jgi:hypothetical protein
MPYKVIITGQEIWNARAVRWEEHYQKRGTARGYPVDFCERVLKACASLPEPKINMFGSIDEWHYTDARMISRELLERTLKEANVSLEILVKWYWSEPNWQTFVNAFNDLPDPFPQYEMRWNGEYVVLVGVSVPLTKSKRKVRVNPLLSLPNVHTEQMEE